MSLPPLPPFLEHAAKGMLFGALVGGGIATSGWVIRQRNGAPIELGVRAPQLIARHRNFPEVLLHYKEVSQATPTAATLYKQLVLECEYVAAHEAATGGAQVEVQKRVTRAINCAHQLCRESFRARHPHCYECKMQIDAIKGFLGGIQKNMMMA